MRKHSGESTTNIYDIDAIDRKIMKEIKKAAEQLEKLGGEIEAVKRNTPRLRDSIKMLELNVSDA